MRNLLIALVTVTLTAAPARAAARLFKAFDFEERQLGNDEDVPMHWSKVTGAGLPHYVVGHLTTDRARSGRYSFRMDLDGGSCAYQYEPALVRVAVGGHYRVSAYCQTTPLAHARARLTLALADVTGQPIPGTEVWSEPYASPTDDAANWHPLSAELTDATPVATYLLVRMELAQPERYADTPGDRSLLPQDIAGSAWFDDVVVAQVPRVSLSTDRPGNVFRRGEAPQLAVTLDDPSTDDLASQLIVSDADGRRVFQRTGTVDLSTAESVGPARHRLTVPLPITPAGWYRATLMLAAPGSTTGNDDDAAAFSGSQSLAYVALADDGSAAPADAHLGVVATALPPAAWPALPDLLPLLAAGRVKLDVPDTAALTEPFNAAVDRLSAHGIAPVGCLPINAPDRATDLIGRHLGQIDRWQLGGDDTDAFVSPDPAARRAYAAVAAAFARLTGHPDLTMPCPLGFDPPAGKGAPAAVTLSVPPSIQPNEIPTYLKDVQDRAAANTGPRVASVSLRPIDGARYGLAARAADLAQRVVYALSAGVDRVDVPAPFAGPSPEPTDLFPVERTVLSALAGTACRGRLPLADGVEAFLFERPSAEPGDHGIAVLWTDAAGPGGKLVTGHLGDPLAATDLWGNVTPLAVSDDGAATLRVGPVPVIVTGVDAPLARFRAGVSIDPPTVESVLLHPQVRHLRLTNPYPQPIVGKVRLRGPAGWTLSPSVIPFELNPGESLDRDLGIDLPVNARAGRNVVQADVELQADRIHQLSLPLAITVGLSDVGVQSVAFRDGSDGVVVQQRITNYADHPVDYTAYVACPGQPRAERMVTALPPGRTVLKRYRFAVPLTGDPIRLKSGLQEANGPRVLNEELTVR